METVTSSFSHALIKYVKDVRRDLSIPVGVALWSEEAGSVKLRMALPNERVPGIGKREDYPFVRLVSQEIEAWLGGKDLPYGQRGLRPTSDAWWRHLQKVLVHKVKVSEPRPIDCKDPEKEIEILYRDIVRPEPGDDTTLRIDGLITRCLGKKLSKKFKRAGEIQGYKGERIQVMRMFESKSTTVVVEGVNLSAPNAWKEADALVSKLWRARSNGHIARPSTASDRKFVALIGCLSPKRDSGVNEHLKSWIRDSGEARVFDILKEKDDLRRAAESASLQSDDSTLF